MYELIIYVGFEIGEKFGFSNQWVFDIIVGFLVYDIEVGGEIVFILDFGNVKIVFYYFIDVLGGIDYVKFDLCLQGGIFGQQEDKYG